MSLLYLLKEVINKLKAAKNALLMPVMSTTPVSTIYTLKESQNGNISKQDAVKIVAYNSIAQALD